MTLGTDARAYVDILNGALNGLGQCVCPVTGAQSHEVMYVGHVKHGRERFNAAVDAIFELTQQPESA
jgi:hypothetical protein